MAVQNVLRNWKKGLIVMLSIALSMVAVSYTHLDVYKRQLQYRVNFEVGKFLPQLT